MTARFVPPNVPLTLLFHPIDQINPHHSISGMAHLDKPAVWTSTPQQRNAVNIFASNPPKLTISIDSTGSTSLSTCPKTTIVMFFLRSSFFTDVDKAVFQETVPTIYVGITMKIVVFGPGMYGKKPDFSLLQCLTTTLFRCKTVRFIVKKVKIAVKTL